MKSMKKWQVIRMRNIWTIMKKEFDRFFKDKRMVLSTLLLPGLMIYLVYSIMGSAMGSQFATDEEYAYKVEVVNMPSSMEAMFTEELFDITEVSSVNEDTLSERISDRDVDAVVVFGGTNDYGHGDAKFGNIDDECVNTYCGAINSLITKLKKDFANS